MIGQVLINRARSDGPCPDESECTERARVFESCTRYVIDHQVRNARIGGQLSRRTARAGLTVETVLPITDVYDDPMAADQVFRFERVTNRAVRAGLISDGEGRHFLEGLAAKPFFASVTLFMVVARKEPPGPP